MGVECLPDAALASLSGAGSIVYIGLALSLSSRTATDYAVSGLTRYCIEPLWLRRWLDYKSHGSGILLGRLKCRAV